jgi:hypothetical protein
VRLATSVLILCMTIVFAAATRQDQVASAWTACRRTGKRELIKVCSVCHDATKGRRMADARRMGRVVDDMVKAARKAPTRSPRRS